MIWNQDDTLIRDVVDVMASKALEDSDHVDQAVERFSQAVDRFAEWLPAGRRASVIELARAHGYCTPEQLERLRLEGRPSH